MDVLREIFVLLGMKTDEKSFANSIQKVEALKQRADQLKFALKAAADSLFDAFVSAGKEAEGFLNLSQRTGVAAQTLQEFAGIAQAAGLPQEAFSMGLKGLALSMAKAADGSGEAAKAFGKLGVHTKDASGKTRPLDAVLGDIAEKFKTMPDGAEKLALSQELLGRQGQVLIPILNKGSAALAEQRAHMRELGVVMDEVALENAAAFDDSMDDLEGSLKGLRNAIVGPLMKPLTAVVEQVWRWVAANKEVVGSALNRFLTKAGALFYAIARVAKPFIESFLYWADTAKGSAVLFGGFLVVLAGMAALFVATTGAALSFAASLIAASAPIIGITALVLGLLAVIGLLVEDFYQFSKGNDSMLGLLLEGLKELGSQIEDVTKGWFDATIKYWKQQFTEFLDWIPGALQRIPERIVSSSPENRMGGGPASSAKAIEAVAGWLGRRPTAAKLDEVSGEGPAASARMLESFLGFVGTTLMGRNNLGADPLASAGQTLSPSFRASFNIQTSPGMDPAAVGSAVRESLDDWFSAKVSQAFESTVGQYSPAEGG